MGAPNILMIMTDQQRRDTLGAYGCSWIPTPNLDPLAASGTVFETCTVDDPVCTPSRASIFTGKPVPDHGVLGVHDNLPQTETLFTERLRREAGYRTALFGKLHVSSRVQEQRQRHPNDGFDIYEWCLEPSVSMDSPFNGYSRWLDETAPAFRDALARNGRRELHHPHDSHMSKWAADRTIDFLQTAKDDAQPFFCLMSLFDPHDPYEDYPIGFADRIDDATIPRRYPRTPIRQNACSASRKAHALAAFPISRPTRSGKSARATPPRSHSSTVKSAACWTRWTTPGLPTIRWSSSCPTRRSARRSRAVRQRRRALRADRRRTACAAMARPVAGRKAFCRAHSGT